MTASEQLRVHQELAERARAAMKSSARSWYRIENVAGDDDAEIYLYDSIGFWGVPASAFVRELREIDASRIALHINSPGGEVFDGIAIHTALKDHPAEIEVRVDGLAASIASVIAMAGDRVEMAKHATMMIHEPWSIVLGDAEDMRKEAEVLDQLGGTIAGVYDERAGGGVETWRARMHDESWYTAAEAVEVGLADEVSGDDEDEAENRFDLSIFKNTPSELRMGPETVPLTARDAERVLRDAGLSARAAKAVLAGGWNRLGSERAGGAASLDEIHDWLVANAKTEGTPA